MARSSRPTSPSSDRARSCASLAGTAGDARRHHHVLERGEVGQELVELEDEPERLVAEARQARAVERRQVGAADLDAALVRRVESAEQVQQGRLARARRTDDRRQRARPRPRGRRGAAPSPRARRRGSSCAARERGWPRPGLAVSTAPATLNGASPRRERAGSLHRPRCAPRRASARWWRGRSAAGRRGRSRNGTKSTM